MYLEVRLLGGFSVHSAETPVRNLNAPRLQSLLAYLLLHANTGLSRSLVASVFWPEMREAAARNNLRQTLHQLRQALPQLESVLRTDTETLQWSDAGSCQVDVREFEQGLAEVERIRAAGQDWTKALEAAVRWYAGDLLPGCYDDWIVAPRDKLRATYAQALEQLVQAYTARREISTAIQYAEAWLALDRLRDEPNIALMGIHAENGDQAAALAVYGKYVAAMRQELDAEPAPKAAQLAERLRSRQARPSIPSAAEVAPARLIGRRHEWQLLMREWERSVAGEARLAIIEGEAGIGKSRLGDELTLWVARQGYAVAQARCYAAEGQLSLAPVAAWLRTDVLRAVLKTLPNLWVSEASRLLPELLLEHPALPRPTPISEYGGRLRFFEALARIVAATARPLLLFIDDVQWCDQETLDWLHFLMRFAERAPLLVVATVRNEELPLAHPFQQLRIHLQHEERLTELQLEPLDAAESAQLAALIADRQLDDRSALRLFQHTEGNPLFIVETMRAGEALADVNTAGMQSEADTLPTLPPRVQAVIAGRLAQLSPPSRALAELAAAIGRPFDLDLLLPANDGAEAETVAALDELWQRRILREHTAAGAPFERYDFTHEKLREVVYGAMSAPRRRLLHHRIAEALALRHAGSLDQISAELAAQYEAAGQVEQAIYLYERACEITEGLYALDDALRWTRRALVLLERRSRGELRDRTELGFLLALARIYRITRGWADHELEAVLERAQSLCVAVGDPIQRSQVLYGLQSVYVVQARHDDVFKLTVESTRLSREILGVEPPSLAMVHPSISQLHVGEFRSALDRFDKIAQVDDRVEIELFQQVQGVNYLILADCNRAEALWCLGLPDAAMQCCMAGWEQARALDQPFNQALAATYVAMLHELRGDATFQSDAVAALALATESKAIYYQLWARILVAYGEAIDNPSVATAVQLRTAIEAFQASGAGLRLPYYLALLARVWQALGRLDDAAATIAEAQLTAAHCNEHWWDAELYRLRADLIAHQAAKHKGSQREAENHYLLAMHTAEQQQALSLQLRAALGLATLWVDSSQADKIPSLLRPIYEQFAEGHATADLVHARRLLTSTAALPTKTSCD